MASGTVKIRLDGVILIVDYTSTPAQRGLKDSLGVPLEPDYPAEIEIEAVRVDVADVTELLNWRMGEIIEATEKALAERLAA